MGEGRLLCSIIGFKVQIKGECKADAPIIVIAPHTSFFDGQIMFWLTTFPSILARVENKSIPMVGKLEALSLPIYVAREDHDSRKITVEKIIERANQYMNQASED